jgi:hypothetical protein
MFTTPSHLRPIVWMVAGRAITRIPLVYRLESVDNPDLDIFNAAIKTESLESVLDSNMLTES